MARVRASLNPEGVRGFTTTGSDVTDIGYPANEWSLSGGKLGKSSDCRRGESIGQERRLTVMSKGCVVIVGNGKYVRGKAGCMTFKFGWTKTRQN